MQAVFSKVSPKQIVPGNYLVVHIIKKNGKILLEPLDTINKKQMWFWSPEWQKKEKKADSDVTKGKISGPFRSAQDLIKSLKS